MWALRASVRRGARLSRAAAGRPTVGAAAPLAPWPERSRAAFGPGGPGGPERRGGGWRSCRRSAAGEEAAGPEDAEGDEELLRGDPLLPAGSQRVCVVHPEVKWGPGKPRLTRAEWQVAEAEALVHTLDGWSVVERMVVPTKTPDGKLIFGRGTLQHLTERIRGMPGVTAVFLNVEKMAAPTKKELEATWGIQVLDRFTVALHIFRCNARTWEARLQVSLAELPLLRSNLKNDTAHLERRGGGSRYIMGSGESSMQVQQRLLREKETKIRKALERLRRKRQLVGQQRRRREFPVISMVGYTNCGKTTLIKALTGDPAIQPRDQLFATLDITAHAGSLPSRMTVLYMDTIGFLSQLPHGLIESFSATLEDVAHSDVIVHVRDVSHPETELQKASVLSTLRGLRLPAPLLDSMVEVHNKVDRVPGYSPTELHAVAVSALLGLGLEELRAQLEDAVLQATGRRVLALRVPLAGAQLSWLHTEATVQDVAVLPEAGVADVRVVISHSAYGRFRKLFLE
ncbi:putative GTP-binding protein 6 [Manis pentadactyla]|uniref:putative GTP-binding protein 6 n=1 Tax=Manis pentadactyla TaxID=143292 RepID=UPI00255CB6E9|nr:putative GTP-binding protein 6 [Manis pentadactyla]XP_057352174.1 putative GTP-binding protein 6 [Manis pentadactyla]